MPSPISIARRSALLATIGVLAALMDRQKTGKGQKVETALLRTAINITNSHLIEQAMLSLNRIATLNRGFTAGPSDTFKCKDGWIYAMTAANEAVPDASACAPLTLHADIPYDVGAGAHRILRFRCG